MMGFRNNGKHTIILGIFLLVFTGFQGYSQTKTFSLQDAIDYALKNNRDIRVSALEIDRAKAAVSEAYGYALPTVDLSANLSHFIEKAKMPFPDFGALLSNATNEYLYRNPGILKDASGNPVSMDSITYENNKKPYSTSLQSFALANNYEASLRVSQILFNSAVFTGIGSSGTYLEASKVMFKAQVSKSVLGVQKAFYAAMLMKEMYTVIQSSYSTFEASVKNVKLLYEQGMVSEYEYLQMKVQLENFKPKVIEAENGYRITLDAFKLAISMDKSESIDISGSYDISRIDVPELDAAVDEAMRKNLDIQSLEYKSKIDNAFVELERADYYPTLAAFGNLTYAGAADDFNFLHYNSSIVGLSLSMNLFNGGRTNKKVEQQLVNVMKTDEQIKTLKDAIAMNIKSKVLDLQKIKENINSTVENVALSERAYQLAEIRLREGTSTQLELLNAEQAKRDAILNKYRAINDYYNAKFEIDNLLGNLNPEYLKNYEKELK
jgi:outer membrane protein TolC